MRPEGVNLEDWQIQRRQHLIEDSVWSEIALMSTIAALSDPTRRPKKMLATVGESPEADLNSIENVCHKVTRWVQAARFVERHPTIRWPAPELLERGGKGAWRFEWGGWGPGPRELVVSVDDGLPPFSAQANPVEEMKDLDTDLVSASFYVTVHLGEPFNAAQKVDVGWSIRAGVIALWPRKG